MIVEGDVAQAIAGTSWIKMQQLYKAGPEAMVTYFRSQLPTPSGPNELSPDSHQASEMATASADAQMLVTEILTTMPPEMTEMVRRSIRSISPEVAEAMQAIEPGGLPNLEDA